MKRKLLLSIAIVLCFALAPILVACGNDNNNTNLATYALIYSAGTGGTISGTALQTVESGKDGTSVTAVANSGYEFVKWSDNVTTAMRTDTNVTANITVTAEFTAQSDPMMAVVGEYFLTSITFGILGSGEEITVAYTDSGDFVTQIQSAIDNIYPELSSMSLLAQNIENVYERASDYITITVNNHFYFKWYQWELEQDKIYSVVLENNILILNNGWTISNWPNELPYDENNSTIYVPYSYSAYPAWPDPLYYFNYVKA